MHVSRISGRSRIQPSDILGAIVSPLKKQLVSVLWGEVPCLILSKLYVQVLSRSGKEKCSLPSILEHQRTSSVAGQASHFETTGSPYDGAQIVSSEP